MSDDGLWTKTCMSDALMFMCVRLFQVSGSKLFTVLSIHVTFIGFSVHELCHFLLVFLLHPSVSRIHQQGLPVSKQNIFPCDFRTFPSRISKHVAVSKCVDPRQRSFGHAIVFSELFLSVCSKRYPCDYCLEHPSATTIPFSMCGD